MKKSTEGNEKTKQELAQEKALVTKLKGSSQQLLSRLKQSKEENDALKKENKELKEKPSSSGIEASNAIILTLCVFNFTQQCSSLHHTVSNLFNRAR